MPRSVISISDSSSVNLTRSTAFASPEPDLERKEEDFGNITLRFNHLKYFFQAAAATHQQPTHMASTPLAPEQLAKAERQRSALQQRIKQNVVAFISDNWDAIKPSYKPKELVVNADSMWSNTVKQQEELMARINTAKKAKSKGDRKVVYDLIMDVREKFPDYVKKIVAPEKPTPAKSKEDENLATCPPSSMLPGTPSKSKQVGKLATCPPSSMIPGTPPPAYQPNKFSRLDSFIGLSSSSATAAGTFKPPQNRPLNPPPKIKREPSPININDTDDSDSETEADAPEDPKDSTFDPSTAPPPSQSREERAAKRQRIKGPEFATNVKNATSKEELMFQLEELRIQMRLKEILIEKKIQGLGGKSCFELEEEELVKQFEMNKLLLGRRRRVAGEGEGER